MSKLDKRQQGLICAVKCVTNVVNYRTSGCISVSPPPKVLLLVVSKIAFMRPENIAYILVVCNYKCYKRFINHNFYYHAWHAGLNLMWTWEKNQRICINFCMWLHRDTGVRTVCVKERQEEHEWAFTVAVIYRSVSWCLAWISPLLNAVLYNIKQCLLSPVPWHHPVHRRVSSLLWFLHKLCRLGIKLCIKSHNSICTNPLIFSPSLSLSAVNNYQSNPIPDVSSKLRGCSCYLLLLSPPWGGGQ